MERCFWCKVEKDEDDFYLYSYTKFRSGREEKSYLCKVCSDRSHGDKWYPIIGYDQKCDISNQGTVRELRGNRYYNITRVQNANTEYVYLTKNGKRMKKNIVPLMKRFVWKANN
ncbi:hypothetical protein [Bacillus sp. XF8]|uniref:hypothetical protein n=1 Tax=Bacillus sp. XF8 TaxID=2819289 RepID=UPI001AA03431|nr:hypothetical protein [Bacillus sp. XF8]MBO1582997.1 hypothetical protein [Bacillus sp. XF8]